MRCPTWAVADVPVTGDRGVTRCRRWPRCGPRHGCRYRVLGLGRYRVAVGWVMSGYGARIMCAVGGRSNAQVCHLGTGTVFDRAVAEFSVAYSGQNERDYEAFTAAIGDRRIPAHR